MEKNDLTLPAQRPATAAHAPGLLSRLNAWLVQTTLIAKLAAFYSFWLEEEVTPQQATAYLYAQLAAMGFFLPFAIGLGWRACFAVLFGLAWKRAQTK